MTGDLGLVWRDLTWLMAQACAQRKGLLMCLLLCSLLLHAACCVVLIDVLVVTKHSAKRNQCSHFQSSNTTQPVIPKVIQFFKMSAFFLSSDPFYLTIVSKSNIVDNKC